jgi:hypothetical protein
MARLRDADIKQPDCVAAAIVPLTQREAVAEARALREAAAREPRR